jgi:hypothetical protein
VRLTGIHSGTTEVLWALATHVIGYHISFCEPELDRLNIVIAEQTKEN